MAFLVYAFSMANLESWMVKRPRRLIPFYLIVAISFAGFEWWRRRQDAVGVALIFDDAADPAVLTLGLGEIDDDDDSRSEARRASATIFIP